MAEGQVVDVARVLVRVHFASPTLIVAAFALGYFYAKKQLKEGN